MQKPQKIAAKGPPKFTILATKKNSPNRFKEGGAEALPTHKRNQNRENKGLKRRYPRFKNILRDPLRS